MFPIPFNFPFRKANGDISTIGAEINAGGGGSSYTLPTASANTKGGVKIGEGLTMDGEVLKNTNPTPATPYTLPTASDDTLGGVKVGTGLSIDENGVLSTSGGGGSTLYEHNIIIRNYVSLKIINGSSTAFTMATLKEFLYNNGFRSKLNCYPATGGYSSSSVLPAVGIYKPDGTTGYMGIVYVKGDQTFDDIALDPVLEIDHVRTI